MAKILQAQDLGPRPSLRANRPVVRDRSGEIEAQGLVSLAQTVSAIAEGMQRRENKFSYANAKSTLLIGGAEARRSLEDDQDWATFDERYREKMAIVLTLATSKIKSRADRKLFELD